MASTGSSNTWTGVLQGALATGLDYASAKLLDVQSTADESNLPDRADLYYGYGTSSVKQKATSGLGGMSAGMWALIGVAVVVGLVVLKKTRVL